MATATTKVCAQCFKPLGDVAVNAMDNKYHPECFVCYFCKKPFPNGKFVPHKGRAYCPKDFEWICATCGEVITDDHIARKDKRYHPACLKCDICLKVVGEKHQMLNDKVLCDEDYELEKKASLHYSQPAGEHGMCASCSKPIHFNPIQREGKTYHDYCFQCTYCRNTIRGEYNKHNGFPICKQCENFICGGCNKVIESEFVTLDGKKLHMTCIRCAFCDAQLNHQSFQKRQGKACCAECLKK